MPRKPKLIDKKAKKKSEGCCKLCGEEDYAVLDVHRITPGAEGGRYTNDNILIACANCHRKIHDGTITIDQWYLSTAGRVLRIIEEGQEKFI